MEKIIYIAIVLADEDSAMLLKKFSSGMGNQFAHHCTIKFGSMVELPSYLGRCVKLRVNGAYRDNKATAVTVEVLDTEVAAEMRSNDQASHITIETADGVKPVYSNFLINEAAEIDFMFVDNMVVRGRIGAFVVEDDGNAHWVF